MIKAVSIAPYTPYDLLAATFRIVTIIKTSCWDI